MRGALGLVLACFLAAAFSPQAFAQYQEPGTKTPSPATQPSQAAPGDAATPAPSASPTSPLPGGETPGERDPLVGTLAAVAIVVAGAAGLFVYRVIRKGL